MFDGPRSVKLFHRLMIKDHYQPRPIPASNPASVAAALKRPSDDEGDADATDRIGFPFCTGDRLPLQRIGCILSLEL
jgi:hypothetical protein